MPTLQRSLPSSGRSARVSRAFPPDPDRIGVDPALTPDADRSRSGVPARRRPLPRVGISRRTPNARPRVEAGRRPDRADRSRDARGRDPTEKTRNLVRPRPARGPTPAGSTPAGFDRKNPKPGPTPAGSWSDPGRLGRL